MSYGVDTCFKKSICNLSDMKEDLTELSYRGILRYICCVQNYLSIEGKVKIVVN